jgi:hypothetical protein
MAGEALGHILSAIARGKPRASLVHVIAAPPDARLRQGVADAVRRATRAGAKIMWSCPKYEQALEPPWQAPRAIREDDDAPSPPPVMGDDAPLAAEAVALRARAAQLRADGVLKKMGVRVERIKPIGGQLVAHEPPEADARERRASQSANAEP